MAGELWRWVLEKLKAFGALLWRGIRTLWTWALTWGATISARTWRMVAVAVPGVFLLYILIGMMIVNRIDDKFRPLPDVPENASVTVELVAGLVERETIDHNWTPNDPFFLPGGWLDNTPSFQKGIMGALSRFTFELRDQIGRTRGSSAVDVDLEKAAGNLSKEPERWIIDFSTSLLPTTPSDSYFREAARQLRTYNDRLANGGAVFERRADNLLATLDRITLDLGASSAAIDDYITAESGGILPDTGADDLFYQVKGQVYAYTLILSALEKDFASVIVGRDVQPLYTSLLVSLRAAASLDPLIVLNGDVDGIMLPNHLAVQGFYLLRARTQLREIGNILLK